MLGTAASKLVLSGFGVDPKVQMDEHQGWGKLSHCRPPSCEEIIRDITGWWTKVACPYDWQSHLSQLLSWQRKAGLGRTGVHTERKTKVGIFLHHLEHFTEGGDVLVAEIGCHQLTSASICNPTVNYIYCSLSAPWHPASEPAPTLEYLCWFHWEQGCVQHRALILCTVSTTSAKHGMWNVSLRLLFAFSSIKQITS